MEIRCRCSACQALFKVEAKYAGKKARCPQCQQVIDVPPTESEEPLVASAPVAAQILAERNKKTARRRSPWSRLCSGSVRV